MYLVLRLLLIACLFQLCACKTEKLITLYQSGEQIPIIHKKTDSPYGYHIFTPELYSDEGPEFPLLIFLHGSGERGNSAVDSTKLDLVLVHGPPQLINESKWNVSNSMIVASPQAHTPQGWISSDIHEFIEYLIANYRVNKDRIYLTGLSMGGFGIFNYVGKYGDQGYTASYVPICGGGKTEYANKFKNIPLWAFHGESDDTVPVERSADMIEAIKTLNPTIKPKLTLYPGVGHNSWSRTYDGSGMGSENTDFDPFTISIYDWMFKYQK